MMTISYEKTMAWAYASSGKNKNDTGDPRTHGLSAPIKRAMVMVQCDGCNTHAGKKLASEHEVHFCETLS